MQDMADQGYEDVRPDHVSTLILENEIYVIELAIF